jgi:phosphatidate cytidylyltransferase
MPVTLLRDQELLWLFGGVVGLLVIATGMTLVLKQWVTAEGFQSTIANIRTRVRAWWVMCAVFAVALLAGKIATVVLFGLISFLALREFVPLIPTRRADHRALLWVFFVILPLQYSLVAIESYPLFSVLIPTLAFLLVPARIALAGDPDGFQERASELQWALMICVYCVSHLPALYLLRIPGGGADTSKLVLYCVLVVQLSDVLQYVWGKLLGRNAIAPSISPNKTWEGFLGGVGCATAAGTALWWATPFTPWQAAWVSLAITLMGFAGGLTMSAIKRDRGVKDYGTLIQGHGGVLDRIDSVCFAAPVFFHLTRYLLARAS